MPMAMPDAPSGRCRWPMPKRLLPRQPTPDSRRDLLSAVVSRVRAHCNHTQLFVREKSALQMYISEPRGWTDLHAPDAHGHYGGHGVPVIATIRYLQSVLCAQCWSRRLMHSTSMLRQDRGVPGCAVH